MSSDDKAISIADKLAKRMPGKFVCLHQSGQSSLGCIKCAAEAKERIAQADRKEQDELISQRKKNNIQTAFSKSGIPPIGLGCYFNNYQIYDDKQKSIVNLCKEYALNFAAVLKTGKSMVLTGDFGAGKNHLAYSIANYVINKGYKAKFRALRKLRREMIGTYAKSYTGPSEQQIIDDLVSPDLLIIDEIGCGKNSDFGENVVLEIVDERKNRWKPTILLSNLDSKGFEVAIGPRCLDRLKEHHGLVLPFTWGSYRSRVTDSANLLS